MYKLYFSWLDLFEMLHVCMGTCPFSLAFSPPTPHLPHSLPAISRANLKLRYYESCTRRVGGRFRTSTPSINRLMGPTSWLNRPVPAPDNLSSDEANLRSQNNTKTFLCSVPPHGKNLFWWLFDFSTTSFKLTTSSLPKNVLLFSLCLSIWE